MGSGEPPGEVTQGHTVTRRGGLNGHNNLQARSTGTAQVQQLGGHSGVWAGHLGGRVEMVQNGQIQNTFEGPESRGCG